MKTARFVRATALCSLLLACLGAPMSALASGESELAQKLQNPVAALISMPFQFNYDQNIGPEDGERWTLNIQPVIPIELNEDWNLISRTILPLISQSNIAGDSGSQTGIGDIVQSLFLSPDKVTESGLVWGLGPVFLLPSGSNDLLSADKWGTGPTAVVLRQQGPWTYGGLANHIWSIAGNDERAEVSATFLQPFVSYTTPSAWTFGLQMEGTYDWRNEQWTIPVLGFVSKVINISGQMVSIAAGVRYYADSPDSGPEGFGFRLNITLLFPK
jgi:hypothetical protein